MKSGAQSTSVPSGGGDAVRATNGSRSAAKLPLIGVLLYVFLVAIGLSMRREQLQVQGGAVMLGWILVTAGAVTACILLPFPRSSWGHRLRNQHGYTLAIMGAWNGVTLAVLEELTIPQASIIGLGMAAITIVAFLLHRIRSAWTVVIIFTCVFHVLSRPQWFAFTISDPLPLRMSLAGLSLTAVAVLADLAERQKRDWMHWSGVTWVSYNWLTVCC